MTADAVSVPFDSDIVFQQTAAGEVVRHVSEIIGLGERDTVVLDAPTGSGKTVIMGFAIKDLVLRSSLQLAFVWLAPFSLHDQGKIRLAGVEQLVLKSGDEISGRMNRNDVVFLNWESVKQQINLIRLGTESKGGLASICAATRKANIKIVLVIDESHYSRETPKADEVIDLIDPAVIVEISATPRTRRPRYVLVDREAVVTAGLIRKYTILQNDLDAIIETHGHIYDNGIYLEAALQKRAELARRYSEAGIGVNPLLLIQLPNGKPGEEMLDDFRRRLRDDFGMTTRKGGNGKLVIWTEGEKSIVDINTEPALVRNDGSVCVFIFKQAVAIGWDCRRAQVLLKVRHESESESFDIQTAGRIMRMPERHHYSDEALNLGYIYAPYRTAKNGAGFGIVTAHSDLREGVNCPPLLASRRETRSRAVTNSEVQRIIEGLIGDLGVDPQLSAEANLGRLRSAGFDPSSRLKETINYIDGRLGGETDKKPVGGGSERLENRDPNTISRLFSEDLEAALGDRVSADTAKTMIVRKVKESIGWKPSEAQSMFLGGNNRHQFNRLLSTTVGKVLGGPRKTERSREAPWSLPPVQRYNAQKNGDVQYQEIPHDGLFAYQPHFVREKQFNPEIDFEGMLIGPTGRTAIEWWHKNRDVAPDGFSITYEMPDKTLHEFLPDYLVGFKDGVIGVFETKAQGAFDNEGDREENRAKIAALNDWAQRQSVVVEFGFVLPEGGVLNRYTSPDRSSSEDFQNVLRRHRPAAAGA